MEQESFNVFLGEKLRDKNVSLEKLAEASGIAQKHLENLLKGDKAKLPPAPYLRGYFVKLGEILDFDGEHAWKEWEKDSEDVKSSGSSDKLPENRFKKKSMAKYVWLGVAALLLIVYGGFALARVLGTPKLAVINPGSDVVTAPFDTITVNGTLQNAKELYINNELIPLDDSGAWSKTVSLQPGLNTIEVVAKKFLAGQVKVVRQIYYEAPKVAPTSTAPTSH